ncbi:hypothetical protein BKA69DRAFT_1067043 [Paraphysoderma sedebokerense]|nr:hypothetical protein BKA69DRAFT_1067043 [Paraphysoderma sedebokerense]
MLSHLSPELLPSIFSYLSSAELHHCLFLSKHLSSFAAAALYRTLHFHDAYTTSNCSAFTLNLRHLFTLSSSKSTTYDYHTFVQSASIHDIHDKVLLRMILQLLSQFCHNLKHLAIEDGGAQSTDVVLEYDFPNLFSRNCIESLSVFCLNDNFKSRTLENMCSVLKNLRKFQFYDSPEEGFLLNSTIKAITKCCPYLRTIELHDCVKVTSSSFRCLLDNLKYLKQLRIQSYTGIYDDEILTSLESVGNESLPLESLKLGMTKEDFQLYRGALQNQWAHGFDRAFQAIINKSPGLKYLELDMPMQALSVVFRNISRISSLIRLSLTNIDQRIINQLNHHISKPPLQSISSSQMNNQPTTSALPSISTSETPSSPSQLISNFISTLTPDDPFTHVPVAFWSNIFNFSKSLTYLHLENLVFSESSIYSISKSCPSLKVLSFHSCRFIQGLQAHSIHTDEAHSNSDTYSNRHSQSSPHPLIHLFSFVPNLTSFAALSTPIPISILKSLVRSCAFIRSINIPSAHGKCSVELLSRWLLGMGDESDKIDGNGVPNATPTGNSLRKIVIPRQVLTNIQDMSELHQGVDGTRYASSSKSPDQQDLENQRRLLGCVKLVNECERRFNVM